MKLLLIGGKPVYQYLLKKIQSLPWQETWRKVRVAW